VQIFSLDPDKSNGLFWASMELKEI